MLNATRGPGLFPNANKTWILVANRSGARFFSSEGAVKDLQLLEDVQHPEGRLKGRDIVTDQTYDDSPISEILKQFARSLSERLNKARSANAFSRLILIAEARLLGEIRRGLDRVTATSVNYAFNKDLANLGPNLLQDRLEQLLLFNR